MNFREGDAAVHVHRVIGGDVCVEDFIAILLMSAGFWAAMAASWSCFATSKLEKKRLFDERMPKIK